MRDRQHAKLTPVTKVRPERVRAMKEHQASLHADVAPNSRPVIEPWGLDETDAAKFLRLSTRTLQRMRLQGGSPPYSLVGRKRILFPIEGLRAWLTSRIVGSTSEATARRHEGTL